MGSQHDEIQRRTDVGSTGPWRALLMLAGSVATLVAVWWLAHSLGEKPQRPADIEPSLVRSAHRDPEPSAQPRTDSVAIHRIPASTPRSDPAPKAADVGAGRGGAFQLEVLDAESGEHLESVFLVAVHGPRPLEILPPSPSNCLVDPELLGTSPVTLSRGSVPSEFWVGGPGRTWARARPDAGASRVRVELDPAGSLTLTDIPRLIDSPLLLRVTSASSGSTVLLMPLGAPRLLADLEWTLDGLGPGSYDVTVRSRGEGPFLGVQTIEVSPGATTDFPISKFFDGADPTLLPLDLAIGLPVDREHLELLGDAPLSLELQPRDAVALANGARALRGIRPPQPLGPGAGQRELVFRIDPGLPRGEFDVGLQPLGWIGVIQVMGDSAAQARVDLPPLAQARISVLDDQSQPAEVERMQLVRTDSGTPVAGHAFQDSDGTWRALGPPGVWTLTASGSAFGQASIEVHAVEGDQQFEIRVAEAFECSVTLVREGVAVAQPLDWWALLELTDSQGKSIPRSLTFEDLRLDTMSAGRVRITSQRSGAATVRLPPLQQGDARASEHAIVLSPVGAESAMEFIVD